jgi:hypothetical protein
MSLTAVPSSPFLATDESTGIIHAQTECTVSQAANFLDMSEGCVNELLETGRIAFRQENGECLLQWNSLLDYEQRRAGRHAIIEEIIRRDQEMGLYDD